jgi:hypothetical protein
MGKNMKSTIFDIFNNFEIHEKKPVHKNHGKDVNLVEFPCVHSNDSEPLSIIWPDLKEGPWIAGGACLRWYQGLPVGESDIDIFCSSPEQAQSVIDEIKSYGRHSIKYESDNAITLSYRAKESNKSWTLQVIKRRYFRSLKEVIDNFDISVCQIGTGGNDWLLGHNTARDIRERNLRMNIPLQPDAAKRMVKYWTYGYRPVDGLLDAVSSNPVGKKMFASNEDYENAF